MSDLPVPDDSSAPSEVQDGETTPSPLEALQRERDELLDRVLRKTAEFDNFKKRTERERREFAEWAAADLIGEVVAVLDDFERALEVTAPPEAAKYREGVELTHRQLFEVLRKRGLQAIDTTGAEFDPTLHQAVAYDESPGARDGEIVGELRRGYRLGERLLRPALVRVAKAS